MSEVLTVRDGIPRFAERLRNGEPSTIVAFGTSMTLFGQYLSRLPSALASATGGDAVRLINSGFRGYFTFAGAFRVRDGVLPHAPDLVLIEFAHNDAADDALDAIARRSIRSSPRFWASRPDCEFAFVYLAPPGVAAAGHSRAMLAYDAVAEYYGFPTFDLAGLAERLVAEGRAVWTGSAAPALTHDGIHHSDAAAELIGGPFAAAFVELLRFSAGPANIARPVRDRSLALTTRFPVTGLHRLGAWASGVPPNHAVRTCEAYDTEVAEPRAPGASFRLRFAGNRVLLWAMGHGALEIAVDGSPSPYRLEIASGPGWSIHTITPPLADGETRETRGRCRCAARRAR